MIRNPIDELEPVIRRAAAAAGAEVDEAALAETRRFTGTPINLPRLVGHAIVAAFAEAALVATGAEDTQWNERRDDGSVRVEGRYNIETLGRAALRALGIGPPDAATGG